jgi:hypothetical protein
VVVVAKFGAKEAYSTLSLTEVRYSINKLFLVEKENVAIRTEPKYFMAC